MFKPEVAQACWQSAAHCKLLTGSGVASMVPWVGIATTTFAPVSQGILPSWVTTYRRVGQTGGDRGFREARSSQHLHSTARLSTAGGGVCLHMSLRRALHSAPDPSQRTSAPAAPWPSCVRSGGPSRPRAAPRRWRVHIMGTACYVAATGLHTDDGSDGHMATSANDHDKHSLPSRLRN